MKDYTEEEMIKILEEHGLKVTQNQSKFYQKKGFIQAGGGVHSFCKTVEQLFDNVEVIGKGIKRRYRVGTKHSNIQTRDDLRSTNSGYRYEGQYCKISDRHLYDEEYYEMIRSFYGSERLLQTMVDAWHEGIESAQLYRREYLARKRGLSISNESVSGYFIYRFISNGEIKYVGLTTALFSRMSQHFTNGHLEKEMYDSVEKVEYIEVESELLMNLLEIYLINKWETEWNTMRVYDGEVNIEYLDDLTKEELWREYSYEE